MLGVVLAGGKGKRFGDDKLFFRIDGKPLVQHAVERLQSASFIDEVVLVASPDNARKLRGLGPEVIVDELTIGPIGGVYTALSLGDAFVAAGDMPMIVPEFVDYLIREFGRRGKIVCVPRWSNGYLEPLHAAYSEKFRDFLEKQIKRGDYSLNGAISSADVHYVDIEELPEGWRESFFNVNQKSDLRKLTG